MNGALYFRENGNSRHDIPRFLPARHSLCHQSGGGVSFFALTRLSQVRVRYCFTLTLSVHSRAKMQFLCQFCSPVGAADEAQKH